MRIIWAALVLTLASCEKKEDTAPDVNTRVSSVLTIIPKGILTDSFSYGIYSGMPYFNDSRLYLSDTIRDETGHIILQNAKFAGLVSSGPIRFQIWSDDIISIYYKENGVIKHLTHSFPENDLIDSLPATVF